MGEGICGVDIFWHQVTSAIVNAYDEWVFTGHENGNLKRYNFKTGDVLSNAPASHEGTVMDLQLSKDRTTLISSSKACHPSHVI